MNINEKTEWQDKEAKYKNEIATKEIQLQESFELAETLHAEIQELATHNATQKAASDEVLKEVQIDAEVHNVTQADRIAKELMAKLKFDNEGPPSRIDRVKERGNRKPTRKFTPSKFAKPNQKRKPAQTRQQKRKQRDATIKTTSLADPDTTFEELTLKPRKTKPNNGKKNAPKKKDEAVLEYDEKGFPIVDITKLVDASPPKKKMKPHKLLSRDDKSLVTERLPDELLDEIMHIHNTDGAWATLYTKPGRASTSFCVGLDDIYKIIDGEQLCNSVINGHAYMLKKELNSENTCAFKIFDALAWTYIRNKSYERLREKKIDAVLAKHATKKYYKLLLFPMNSNANRSLRFRPNHWTLLVYDTRAKKWLFYNSNLPRGPDREDIYIEDAKVVMSYVKKKIEKLGVFPTFKLDSQIEYEFEVVQDCPYQGGTVDCALYVCHNMETIVRGGQITKDLTFDQMIDYKVQMIGRFVHQYMIKD